MHTVQTPALGLSETILQWLKVLNYMYGAAIVALLVISLANPDFLFPALGVKQAAGVENIVRGMRLIALIGIVTIPINHTILDRLLAIVHTVRDGDPFVLPNARRLDVIAWCLLSLEVIHLLIGAIAAGSSSSVQPLDIDWTFSLTPWIAVLLLFVLARVFQHGARMRADLAGTV